MISRSCAGVARSASKPCSGSDLPVELSPLPNSIAGDVPLPPGVRELEDVLAAVLVHALAELAPERHAVVALDRRVAGTIRPARSTPHQAETIAPTPAAGEPQLPVDPRLRAGAVVVVEAARDARAEDPVLHLEVPEPERLEDRVVGAHCRSAALGELRGS